MASRTSLVTPDKKAQSPSRSLVSPVKAAGAGAGAAAGIARGKKVLRKELSEEEVQEIREAFNLFDSDHSGQIDYRELKVAMRALGFPVRKEDLKALLKQYDKDDSSSIEFDEFKQIMIEKMAERDPADEMSKAFTLFDDDQTGKITLRNLRRVARELGEEVDDEELFAMIKEFDLDGDDQISPAEFALIIEKGLE